MLRKGCPGLEILGVLQFWSVVKSSHGLKKLTVPGHNNSLSVALTLSSLPTHRNTKFTQAQNVALLQIAQPNSYYCVCTAPASIMDN